MNAPQELYPPVILEHGRRPRNLHVIPGARRAEGSNRLCGDRATVYLELEGDHIRAASFLGQSCSIYTASASMMTERLKGRTAAEAEALLRRFQALVTLAPGLPPHDAEPELGELEAFSCVRAFPARVACAWLPWLTFKAALAGETQPVLME